MSKLIVDTIQKYTGGGVPLTIPVADGTPGQFLKTNGAGVLGWDSMADVTEPKWEWTLTTGTDSLINVGTLFSHSDRGNQDASGGAWTTAGPNGTFTNYNAYADPTVVPWVNMALGDGMSDQGISQVMYGADSMKDTPRQLEFANGNRVGHKRDVFDYLNATTNGGVGMRILPIRNTTGAAITITLAAYASNYSSANDGACLFVLAPNTTLYSSVTAVTSTMIANNTATATDGNGVSLTSTYSVPANRTVLVCLSSTTAYQTSYRFKDCNVFSDLSTTFANPGIICDMIMLQSLYTSRFNIPYTGTLVSNALTALWTVTATNYGDR